MYAFYVNNKALQEKNKATKNNVIAKSMILKHYIWCLWDEIEMMRLQSRVRSKLMNYISHPKIVLSLYDNKRYINIRVSTNTQSEILNIDIK